MAPAGSGSLDVDAHGTCVGEDDCETDHQASTRSVITVFVGVLLLVVDEAGGPEERHAHREEHGRLGAWSPC